MTTTIVVAEHLGCGFWLEGGTLMAGAILADGSGFDEPAEVDLDGESAERVAEVRAILEAVA